MKIFIIALTLLSTTVFASSKGCEISKSLKNRSGGNIAVDCFYSDLFVGNSCNLEASLPAYRKLTKDELASFIKEVKLTQECLDTHAADVSYTEGSRILWSALSEEMTNEKLIETLEGILAEI